MREYTGAQVTLNKHQVLSLLILFLGRDSVVDFPGR